MARAPSIAPPGLTGHQAAQRQLAKLRREITRPAANRPLSRRPQGFLDALGASPPKRWTALRKLELLNAIAAGEISRLKAFTQYGVTEDELDSWVRMWAAAGTRGLMTTRVQEVRS